MPFMPFCLFLMHQTVRFSHIVKDGTKSLPRYNFASRADTRPPLDGECLNYNQYVTIVDRMDYSAPIYNELAWHRATEKLMNIDLTPRCKVLRTIAGELGRLQSHLLCIGAAGLDLGAFTAFLYGFNEREVIYDIVEYISG